jgi:hypothetical protein
MFGITQDNFNSDHFWNAVKVDGKWYYIDPCYTDVYNEVMIRERVETDGYMNHMYFMFSHKTCTQMYDGYYSEIKTLYKNAATHTDYEDSWISRIKSNAFSDGEYFYYVYSSMDMITMLQDYSNGDLEIEDMMNEGLFKQDDPSLLAMELTSPVVVMIAKADRQPQYRQKVMQDIEKHLRHFCAVYMMG